MAIRIRKVYGVLIALCAANTKEKKGDIYLHDGIHEALSDKFYIDCFSMGFTEELIVNSFRIPLMAKEEIHGRGKTFWKNIRKKIVRKEQLLKEQLKDMREIKFREIIDKRFSKKR